MISRLGKASIMAASMPPKEAMPRTDLRISSVTSDGSARSTRDRKSTRLNSSHSQISYAVFCLKKKKNNNARSRAPLSSDRSEPQHAHGPHQQPESSASPHSRKSNNDLATHLHTPVMRPMH